MYVLDGIATFNEEVGICGSRFSPCNVSPPLGQYKEGPETAAG
jgi:putative aminopeptidase FrvX